MGERKVLNKYYPPDFDPAKIPRRREPKNQQIKVRMMLPMSIRCNTCGNYIYKGTKFNSRKEDVIGQSYLGIQIFRFYFKCTKCSAELAMKTDPQNSDYVMESGATRNFEPWRAEDEAMETAKKQRESEEMGDAMKALENRTLDSKQEMDIMAALDEMKSMRARHAQVNTEDMLKALRQTAEIKEQQLAKEDEAVLQSVVFRNSQNYVRRLEDGDSDDDESFPSGKKAKVEVSNNVLFASNGKTSTETRGSGNQIKGPVSIRPQFSIRPRGMPSKPNKLAEKDALCQDQALLQKDLGSLPQTQPNSSSVLASLASYDSDEDD